MTGATHRLGGIAVGILIVNVAGMQEPIGEAAVVAGSLLGSLLPDIDNPRSSISYQWPVLRMIVGIGQGAVRLLAAALPGKMRKRVRSMAGHRGIIHSPCIAVFLFLLILLAGKVLHLDTGLFALGLFAGMLSHIFLDMFSGGAPLGMPFTTERVTLARIKTGGAVEWMIRSIAVVAIAYKFGGGIVNEIFKWSVCFRV